jgi:hypothetical protein
VVKTLLSGSELSQREREGERERERERERKEKEMEERSRPLTLLTRHEQNKKESHFFRA